MRARLPSVVATLALTMCAVPAWAQTGGVIPDAGIRVNSGPSDDYCRQVRLAGQAGFPWVSVVADWETLEPSRGVYADPNDVQRLLTCAKNDGLNTQLVVSNAPAWASGRSGVVNDPPLAQNIPAYGDFLRSLTPRLASVVDVWTPWNEPNFDMFWARPHDPVRYVSIQKTAYAAIKPLDPMSLVSAAPFVGTSTSSSTNTWDYLQAAYDAGLAGNADIIMHNFYPRTAPEDASQTDYKGRPAPWALASETYLRQLVDANDPGRPIWITETSHSNCVNCDVSAPNARSEVITADYITRMYLYRRRYLQGAVDRLFWFELRDSGPNLSDWFANQGIYRFDWTPKPAVAALDAIRVAGTTPDSPGVTVPAPGGSPGGSSGGVPSPTIPSPRLPAKAARPPFPAKARGAKGVRVALGRLRVTPALGRITLRLPVRVSAGGARLRIDGFRAGGWRRVTVVRLPRSADVRLRFTDRGWLGVRVLLRPEADRRWIASRVARVPAAR